jgi:hypothetical protein
MDHILENEGKPVPDLGGVVESSTGPPGGVIDIDDDDNDGSAAAAGIANAEEAKA